MHLLQRTTSRNTNDNKGYTLTHRYKPNVYIEHYVSNEIHIPILAYIDDTSYITHNKENMELQLAKADSF